MKKINTFSDQIRWRIESIAEKTGESHEEVEARMMADIEAGMFDKPLIGSFLPMEKKLVWGDTELSRLQKLETE